jgi:tRNA A-37 threonylcarbamoyl transferase component Bud32
VIPAQVLVCYAMIPDLPDSYLKFARASIVAAVQASHELGLLHGDLRPANIVRKGDKFKLVDFHNAQYPYDDEDLGEEIDDLQAALEGRSELISSVDY